MKSARVLKILGLVWMAVFAVLGTLFIAGETFVDPGGWRAAGLTAIWLVPMVLLGVVAWYRPGPATTLLAILVAVAVAFSIWFAVDPAAWRSFENDAGPVRAIVSFALLAPLAILGWKRPLPAGLLLLILGVAPVVLSGIGSREGLTSLSAVSIPGLITGGLYLLSALVASGSDRQTAKGPRA